MRRSLPRALQEFFAGRSKNYHAANSIPKVQTFFLVLPVIFLVTHTSASARPSCSGPAGAVRTMAAIISADNRGSLNDVLPFYTRAVIWVGPKGVLRGFDRIRQSYIATYSRYKMDLKTIPHWKQGDAEVAYVGGTVSGWLTDKASSRRKAVNDRYLAVLRCDRSWRVELLTWEPRRIRKAINPVFRRH